MTAKTIPFHKMQASGNDFVVIDHRKPVVSNPTIFAQQVCERHVGIGADGVLLLERSSSADFRMRIFNADGSEAEMCGNGIRCAALFGKKFFKLPKRFSVETRAGMVPIEVEKSVRFRLPNPTGFRMGAELAVGKKKFQYYFVDTGVPHAVLFVEELASLPVEELGAAIRFHEVFRPAGTNVDFVKTLAKNRIRIRTYERGVGETLACGTGVAASAIISVMTKRCASPVQVETKGGDCLTVHLGLSGRQVTDVYMEGPATFVFEGQINR